MGKLEPARADLVRRLFEGETLSITEIAELSGVARRTIQNRARAGGWRRARAGTAPAARPVERGDVLARLWTALDDELDAGATEGAAAASRLPNLARTLEKLVALEQDMAAHGAGEDGDDDDDYARLLEEIARRVEALE